MKNDENILVGFEELNDTDAQNVDGGVVAPDNPLPWWCAWLILY